MPAINLNFDELGCILDEERLKALIQERTERGDAVMSSAFAARFDTSLTGYWNLLKSQGVRGVFLRDAEPKLFKGKYRRPYLQRRGTCVSRGFGRGAQTSLDFAIAFKFNLSQPVELSFAQLYSDARHLGGDRFSSDGAIPAEAAKTIHDIGIAPRSLFGDMTEDEQEQLAVKYAAPRVKTPEDWHKAAAGHTAVTFWPETLPSICDCLAAGYAVPYAGNYVTGQPSANGYSDIGGSGAHCRYLSAVFVDDNGEDQWESTESWGRFPAGSPHDEDQTMPVEDIPRITIAMAGPDGKTVRKQLAPGSVAIKAKRFYDMIRNGGEAWAVGVPAGFVK